LTSDVTSPDAGKYVRRLPAWIAVVALVLTSVAQAQGQPADRARAQRLYDEGDRAELASDWSTALAKFEEALTIVETAQLRLRAGRCQEKLGKPLAALQSYQRATLLAKDDPDLLALAQPLVAAATVHVPKIVLRLPNPAPAGLTVRIDGKAVANPGVPQPVETGKHEIEASADGFTPFQRSVHMAEGATEEVVLTLAIVATVLPPPATPRWGVLPWIFIGGGGATLAASIGLGYASFDAKRRAYDELGPAVGCPGGVCSFAVEDVPDSDAYREFESEINRANAFLGASISLGVLAAGLGATGIAFVMTNESESAAPTATALPVVTPDGAHVILVGSF